MKVALLLVLATALFTACVYFYYRSGELVTEKDYIAGALHLIVGLSLTKAAVELARLAILAEPRATS